MYSLYKTEPPLPFSKTFVQIQNTSFFFYFMTLHIDNCDANQV